MDIERRLVREISDSGALGEAKAYINRQVDEACRPLLDEMRAAEELSRLFPGESENGDDGD